MAFTRSGNTWRIFSNGELKSTATSSVPFGSGTNILTIGNYGGGGSYGLNGYLDEFRIIKGKAVRTDDFEFPTSPY
ncbi:MAG: hypothetical protein PHZ26_00570 [Candidatus Gracilibacteria bacterium]|nr:hypothetical protein [Candidatus Gracilibacteria bacterium]MDD2908231.1 hypothetical protein [Candidatus Gracilibacteria bacterium]